MKMHSDDEIMVREREGNNYTERPVKLDTLRARLTGDNYFDATLDLMNFKSKLILTVPPGATIKMAGLHLLTDCTGNGKLSLGGDLVTLPDLKKNTKKIVNVNLVADKERPIELFFTGDAVITSGRVRVIFHYNTPITFQDV